VRFYVPLSKCKAVLTHPSGNSDDFAPAFDPAFEPVFEPESAICCYPIYSIKGMLMSKILMLDNYDSFTFNLVQYFGELGADVEVYRNDQITLDEVQALAPDFICISPGPCSPNEAGISVPLISLFAGHIPILGVCLGHQAIGAAFGARIVRAKVIMHGKTSEITHTGSDVFTNLPSPFTVIRYHSLAIERETLPDCLAITAETADGEIMGVRHKTLPVYGVQFHPESILSEHGHALLQNFLKLEQPTTEKVSA